jgi:putative PIN family toxin of toxin-antitoxin system
VRIAIDTNCLVAALTNPRGSCARIVQAWLDGDVEVVASEATVREAELVVGGGWLARMVGRHKVRELIRHLRTRSVWVERPARITDLDLKDLGDLRMVETAVAGGARFVVTTDREFLLHRGYPGVEFVTPGQLRRMLEPADDRSLSTKKPGLVSPGRVPCRSKRPSSSCRRR